MVTKKQELTKGQVMRSFDTLPEDATVEDFVNHLASILRIEDVGLTIAKHQGQTAPVESMKKNQLMKSLVKLPEDATVDDVIYHLYVISKVENGLVAAKAGDKVSQEEARKLMKHWLQ